MDLSVWQFKGSEPREALVRDDRLGQVYVAWLATAPARVRYVGTYRHCTVWDPITGGPPVMSPWPPGPGGV